MNHLHLLKINYLKHEETPKEVLEARKAQLEFDQNVRPGMTMVDDTEIPASKEEIEAAKEKFMKEKDIDLSILDEIQKKNLNYQIL